jgi:hypothetical protein
MATSPSTRYWYTPAVKLDVLTGGDQRLLFGTLGSDPFINAVNAANSSYRLLQLNGSEMKLMTGGSERLRIDSSGNVGIGTSLPTQPLDVNGNVIFRIASATTSRTLGFTTSNGVDGWTIGNGVTASANQFVIYSNTAGAARLLINSSGNVGIGTSSPANALTVNSGTTNTVAQFISTDSGAAILLTDNVGSSSIQTTDEILRIGVDEDAAVASSAIAFRVDGSEKVRIDPSGNLHVGKTATSNTTAGTSLLEDGSFAFIVDQGDGGQEVGVINNQTSGTYVIDFRQANTDVGRIRVTASATEYQTSSDYRLKENVTYDWDAIPRLKELKPVRFNWIKDSTNTVIDGFIAHEAQEVVPESVGGDKDEVYPAGHEKAGQPNYQGIDQSKLVPLLAKAMIEQQEIIEQLQADVAELKGA